MSTLPLLPCEMVGDGGRADQVGEGPQPAEVILRRRFHRRQREADAVERDREALRQRDERSQARSAIDHVVFGVDLEPQARVTRCQRFIEMLELETQACGHDHRSTPQAPGVSEPKPLGVLILAQVPAGTSFHASF